MLRRLKTLIPSWEMDTPSRRHFRRWMVEIPALLEADGTTYYCVIADISPQGARLKVMQAIALDQGTQVSLDVEGFGILPAATCYANGGIIRLTFLQDERGEEALSHWLMWRRPQRRQVRYECRIEATLRSLDREYGCMVTDLSRNGAALSMSDTSPLAVSSEVVLALPDGPELVASVRYKGRNTVGLMLIDGYHGELPPPIAATGK